MSTALALARCSHPAPTVAVTLFTLAMALGVAGGGRAALITTAVAAGQLSVGWSNDWLDRARDRRVGRRDKPLVTGAVTDATVGGGALAALGTCAVLSLAAGAAAGAAHLLAVAFAWSYNAWLKSTPASPLPYAAAFALLPAFVTLASPVAALPPAWALLAGALLGAGAHFTNTLADFGEDAVTGVRGLPHRLGARTSVVVAALLLGSGGVAVAVGPARPLPTAAAGALAAGAALVAAVVVAGLAGRGRAAFRLTIATAGAVVVAFLSVGLSP